jgi:hypothetical protein
LVDPGIGGFMIAALFSFAVAGTPGGRSVSAQAKMEQRRSEPTKARHVFLSASRQFNARIESTSEIMNEIIYLVGLVVVVMFILSALGLR